PRRNKVHLSFEPRCTWTEKVHPNRYSCLELRGCCSGIQSYQTYNLVITVLTNSQKNTYFQRNEKSSCQICTDQGERSVWRGKTACEVRIWAVKPVVGR